MKTNALFTDLTPQQEEKVTGGFVDPVSIALYAFIISVGGATAARWFKYRR